MTQRPPNLEANTGHNNHNGIVPEDYKDMPLPEDYEITELLSNVISAEYVDVAEDGKSLIRNGIVLPNQVVDQRAWRIAKVKLVGPDCRQVKPNDIVIFPGDRGIQGIQRNGKMVIFLSEDRIFGICKQDREVKTVDSEVKVTKKRR
jgi:co-chaperonin GroES (HSP10)